MESYGDAVEDGIYGSELPKSRLATVTEALVALSVSRDQISASAGEGRGQTSAQRISEYCRQSYRRVGLVFFRAHG